MAKVVEQMPENARNGKYPWSTWLDYRAWELTKGEDYENAKAFESAARAAARTRGLSLTLRVSEDGTTVHLQASPKS